MVKGNKMIVQPESPACLNRRRRTYPWTEHGVGIALLVVLTVLLFVGIGDEQQIAAWFRESRLLFPSLASCFATLSKYGNIPFYGLYLYVFLRSRSPERGGDRRFVVQYLLLLVLLLLVTDMLKIWIGRPRPGEAGEYLLLSLRKAQHSFPSNHMTETAFTLISLAVYFRNRAFTLFCSAWVALAGLARMYLGRHHPTDLLGSVLLGSIGVYLLWRLWNGVSEEANSVPLAANNNAVGREMRLLP